jgi:diguanylate cyclase (GGDEF)-like protein
MLGALASGLSADTIESGRRAQVAARSTSPELVQLSEETSEDLVATSAGFIEVLLASLLSDSELPWQDYEQRSRDNGKLRAMEGVPLEYLIYVLAAYRHVTIELISLPLQGAPRRDEILALAQSRLQNVTERLTLSIARGYQDYIDDQHRARESETFGLAAIVTAMGRSMDVMEIAEVALVESLAALHLRTGALWSKEKSSFKLLHTVGLDQGQVEEFAKQAGPHVKASGSAAGRSESRIDRVSGSEWNALRAQLRAHGRTVGMMTMGTMADRVFNASDMLFVAVVADQVAIALGRARQFSSEARTDHLTGLANQREFERVMEREIALAERHDRRLSLMMIDLDNLKVINDRFGHPAGDECLRLVAQQLLRVVRTSDVCARVGGDEFAVAMHETELHRVREVALRLRIALQQMNLAAKSTLLLEVSVGFAAWRPGQDWRAAYQAAATDLDEDKRRRKSVRSRQVDERLAPIRLLGRTGRRRSSARRDPQPTTPPGPARGL